MTSLKEIHGLNEYCGPAVLAALTGRTTDECAGVISSINGRREIKAVNIGDLIKAFQKLRFDVKETNFGGGSLYGTIYRLHTFDGFYIILIPKHVVAIEVKNTEIFLIDNHSRTALPIQSSARLMQKVDKVYQVIKKEEPKFLKSEITIEKHPSLIYINRRSIYEKKEDNTTTCIGRLSYLNFSELEEVINELAKINEVP